MNSVAGSLSVLDEFAGTLTWAPSRAHGDIFPFAVRCQQGLPASLARQIDAYCRDKFGPAGPGGRWSRALEHVAFRHEPDLMLFLLAWKGRL